MPSKVMRRYSQIKASYHSKQKLQVDKKYHCNFWGYNRGLKIEYSM